MLQLFQGPSYQLRSAFESFDRKQGLRRQLPSSTVCETSSRGLLSVSLSSGRRGCFAPGQDSPSRHLTLIVLVEYQPPGAPPWGAHFALSFSHSLPFHAESIGFAF